MKQHVNSRLEWIAAFVAVMEQYREPRQTQGSIGALDYERAGNSTGGGRCTKIVRPTVLDFICDVELAAHRALSNDFEARTLFDVFYRDYKVEQITVDEVNRVKPEHCECCSSSTNDLWVIKLKGNALRSLSLDTLIACADCRQDMAGCKKLKPAYITELPEGWTEVDQRIRERVGRMFIARRIFPVGSYMSSKDVRN